MSDTTCALACFLTGCIAAAITVALQLPALLGLAFGAPVAVALIVRTER